MSVGAGHVTRPSEYWRLIVDRLFNLTGDADGGGVQTRQHVVGKGEDAGVDADDDVSAVDGMAADDGPGGVIDHR